MRIGRIPTFPEQIENDLLASSGAIGRLPFPPGISLVAIVSAE